MGAERGQATVEAAMTLPIVLIALLLIVQVGVVVRDAMSLVQAAREGARTAAVTGDDTQAAAAVLGADGSLDDDRVTISVQPPSGERARGGAVTVQLSYADKLTIPIVSKLVSFDVPLRSTATMRIEQTPPTPSPSAAP
jgi:Flp pilus assembly protein TadG